MKPPRFLASGTQSTVKLLPFDDDFTHANASVHCSQRKEFKAANQGCSPQDHDVESPRPWRVAIHCLKDQRGGRGSARRWAELRLCIFMRRTLGNSARVHVATPTPTLDDEYAHPCCQQLVALSLDTERWLHLLLSTHHAACGGCKRCWAVA